MSRKVVITPQRGGGYVARIDGTTYWGQGETREEAVGNLVIMHAELCGFEFDKQQENVVVLEHSEPSGDGFSLVITSEAREDIATG